MNISARRFILNIMTPKWSNQFCSDAKSIAQQKKIQETKNEEAEKQGQTSQQTLDAQLEKLQKYYSIKIIHKNNWIQGQWCPIFVRRELTQYEKAQRRIQFFKSFLPSLVFGAYWAMIGPYDYFHIAVAGILGLQIFRSSIIRIYQHQISLEALYLHKNGYEWAIQLPKNFTEERDPNLKQFLNDSQETEIIELRQTLNSPKSSIVFKFPVWNINSTILQNIGKEEQVQQIKQFSDLESQQFETIINVHTDYERTLQYDLKMNAKPEFNDFFKPFINKQRVVFSFKSNENLKNESSRQKDNQSSKTTNNESKEQ